MRKLLLGLIVFVLGVGASALLLSPGAGARTLDGTLTGSVGTSSDHDAFVINLAATTVAPGTYQINITDYSSMHNFDLCKGTSCTGSNSVAKTSVSGTGSVSWTVDLTPGTYTYQCDMHPLEMSGQFTVSGGTTSSSTTTGTSPVLKVKITNVVAKRKAVTVTAKASQLTHVTAVLLQGTTQLASAAKDGTTVKLKLKPVGKLAPGTYVVQVTVACCGTSTTKKKKIHIT